MKGSRGARILVDLSVAPIGGAGTYTTGFVNGLIEGDVPRRSDIVLLVSRSWAELNHAAIGTLRRLDVAIDVVDLPPPGTWRARFGRGRLLRRSARHHGCGVVFIPRDVAPRVGIPYIILARNRYAWQHSPYKVVGGWLTAVLLRTAARRSAIRAQAVLAVSESFSTLMPARVEVTGVVHHGCSMEEGPSARVLSEGQMLAVTVVANLIPSKAVEVVIEGVALFSAVGRQAQLRVFGHRADPEYAIRLERQAEVQLGSSSLCGPVMGDALVDVYRRSHIVAVGSSFETFCLPLVEGMRAGCVIVAPRCALVEEICGDVAVCYTEGDPASLAGAIETATVEWSKRSGRSIQRSRRFDWNRTVERTLEYVRASSVGVR